MGKRIAIDLVPIRVGEGGTGSGIWTYARELVRAMDPQVPEGMEVLCLVNAAQVPYLGDLKRIRLVVFPVARKNIMHRLLWVHVRLPWCCRRYRIDVLHKLATETPMLCGAARVTTVHDFYYEYRLENHPPQAIGWIERLEKVYFLWMTRMCFRRSRRIVVVSEATRREAEWRYPAAVERLRVVPHGAPAGGSAARRAESAGFTLLCVAKFMEHKGQHRLIAAFDVLLAQHPELADQVTLRLRGFHNDAAYFAQVQRRIAASRGAERIVVEPFDPAETTESLYSGVDLVVLLSAYEGFGLPVLEAQALGIPVLCSDLPVLREVGGDGAVYVARDEAEAVAEALYRFIVDPGYRVAQARRAAENVGRFSWSDAAAATLGVYREC